MVDELDGEELMDEMVDELDGEEVMDAVVDKLSDEELMDEVVDELNNEEVMDEVVDEILLVHNIFCGSLTSSFKDLFLVARPLKCISFENSGLTYRALYNSTRQYNLIRTS